MKKKITHSVLFVAVLAGTTALTLFAGRGNLSSTIYNFVFLAVIAVLYLIAMFGGMFRMNNPEYGISQSSRGAEQYVQDSWEDRSQESYIFRRALR
ncbi:MAG: hypothetical protein ACLTZM_21020 [Ruminococcus sp.]